MAWKTVTRDTRVSHRSEKQTYSNNLIGVELRACPSENKNRISGSSPSHYAHIIIKICNI